MFCQNSRALSFYASLPTNTCVSEFLMDRSVFSDVCETINRGEAFWFCENRRHRKRLKRWQASATPAEDLLSSYNNVSISSLCRLIAKEDGAEMRMLFSRRLRAVWSRLGLVALVLWGLVALVLLWQPALPSPPVRSSSSSAASSYTSKSTSLPRHDLYGEEGKPVVLASNISADVKKLIDEGWEKNAFNQYVSDLISLHRTLPDPRDPWCKEPDRFVRKLPPTSVIICFHNEAWSVLLRTVHSVIDRSPKELIREIILVDDFSNMAHLKRQLEEYMAMYPVVKIVRAQRREGLIRARLLGAKHAKGPVLTYLDSHCECAEGWLEPLLDRIARDPTTVVCPVIDVIDDSTLEYHWRDAGGVNVGGFDWNLQFNWHVIPEREKKRHKNQAEPVYSPTMAGGLFSIDKNFFERLGTYDSGFDIWGGENLELSFKTWMCGGTLEIVPCSHVGHIFRKRSPYKWKSGVNVLKRNSVRLAEVWMDEYSKYYYQRVGNDLGDYGDVSSRKELRKRLKCRSFRWYLDTVFPELFIPGDAVASGEVRNLGYGGKTCLDSPARKNNMHKPVGLYPCHKMGGNQYWMLSKEGEIRRDEACLDYAGQDVILYPCHGSKGNQLWIYNHETNTIQHGSSKKCLAISESKQRLLMADCNLRALEQHWRFENFNASKLSSAQPEQS